MMNYISKPFPLEQNQWENVFSPLRINQSPSSYVANFGSIIETEYVSDMSSIIDKIASAMASEVLDEYLDEQKNRETKRCAKTAISGNRVPSALGVVRQPNKRKRSAMDKIPSISNAKSKAKIDSRSRSKLSGLKPAATTKPSPYDM